MTLKEREYLVGHIRSLENDIDVLRNRMGKEKDDNLRDGWLNLFNSKIYEKAFTENILIYFSHPSHLEGALKAQNEKLKMDEEYKTDNIKEVL